MARTHDLPQPPVVNSAWLFRRLLDLYGANLVCDVGSFDGTHALTFARPGTRVVALEANPTNAEALANNGRVADAGIDVFHVAAWNKDEDITFNVIGLLDGDANKWQNKISSIRSRRDFEHENHEVTVRATRLNAFVAELNMAMSRSIALWIDVEGVGFEVLEGIKGMQDEVCVIHIEVETSPFWEQQHLWPDVQALMSGFGFTAVARGPGDLQFDVVIINDAFRQQSPFATRWLIILSWVRWRAGRLLGCVRRAVRALYPARPDS